MCGMTTTFSVRRIKVVIRKQMGQGHAGRPQNERS